MTTTLVWMWLEGCLIKHNKNPIRKIGHYILQSVQPNIKRWDTLNPKETQGSNTPKLLLKTEIHIKETHKFGEQFTWMKISLPNSSSISF
jgi:hypothetical protein